MTKGGGAFHQYLRMEMMSGEYGSYSREVMLHVLGQIERAVPEADRRETLAMLFGPCQVIKLTYDGRRPKRWKGSSRVLQPSQDASEVPSEGNPSS